MGQLADIFDHSTDFDPAADLDAFLAAVPAKWVVYAFADAADRPVQLLCVKNLRASLRRRLGEPRGDEAVGPSKRVNYPELVRRVHWRRVDSAFEADWVYYEAARRIFPESYRGMVGFRPAWFVHVDPEAEFPRYAKSSRAGGKAGSFIGPIEDKHAAARLIELAEDAFDLCRYYNILTAAPHGKACAYKEMGKCPAPCDGSISMPQYRRMIQWSSEMLVDPAGMIADQTARMQAAAAELRFETAARIKSFIDQLGQFGQGPFRHARRLEDFAFASLQPGPRTGTAKLFLILPGVIEDVAGIIAEPTGAQDLLRQLRRRLDEIPPARLDEIGAERIGLVASHLFQTRRAGGPLLPLHTLDERTLARSVRQILKRKAEAESDEEGIVKELEAI